MNFIDTLKENDLYLTDFTKPTIVDAVRAVYNLCGKNFPESPATKEIKKILDVPKHILFILSDGMGSNLIDNLNDHSILKKNKIMDLQTVNPSTTGCAIPSIVTGEYPCTHGLIGWLSHNKKLKIDYLPVLFSERLTGKSLKEFNISEDEIYQSKSVLNSLSRKSYALFPDYIVDSTFSSFILESNNRIPYLDIHDAFLVTPNGKNIFPEEIENEIAKFPEIKECLVFGEETKDDTVISAVVTLDEEYLKEKYGKNIPDLNKIKEIVWEKIKVLNKKMVSYKAVKNLKIRTTDFAKTTTMKIKRFLDSNKKGE